MSKSIKKVCIILMALFAFVASVFAINSMTSVRADVTGGTTDAIVMDTKAQVRLDDIETADKDETGMRFFINVDSKKVDGILANYQGYSVEYGVALLPAKFLDGGELDVEGTYIYNQKEREVLKIKLTNGIENDGIISFKAVLTDIPTLEYETDVAARAYIKLTKADSTIYLQSETSTSKAIGEVATSYYNDPNVEMDEEERGYYEKLLSANVGTLSFDKQEYVLFKNGVNAKTITEDFKIYGNKYGFEIDLNSDFAKENDLQIAFGTEGVASYDGNTFVPVSRGTTTVSVTLAGKTATATVKVETEEDLKATLATDEIAAYDHEGYETMVEAVAGTDTFIHSVSVGDYFGKTGVLKVAGETKGGMSLVKIDLPTELAKGTTITMQMYVVYGSVGGGGLGLSSSSTSVSWDGGCPILSTTASFNEWENFVVTTAHENCLYFTMGVTGVTFEYYISTIMVGDQVLKFAKEELASTLADGELSKFNDEKYLQLINYGAGLSSSNTTVEIIDDPLGQKGKVLHAKAIPAFGSGTPYIEINLPKTIVNKFSMTYRMVIDGADDSANAWGFLMPSWVSLQPCTSVETWSVITVVAGTGTQMFKIGFNQAKTFDLYISIVTTDVDKTANRELYNETLYAKLVDNQLATFNELAYTNYVESQDLETFNVEIIDDPLGEEGKILHVTAKPVAIAQLGTPRIVLFLPKAVTSQFTMNYRVVIDGADDSINAYGIMWPGASAFTGGSWDLGLKPASNVESWSNYAIGGGYSELNYIVIGLNQQKTFDFYISGVVEGWVN